MDWNRGNLEVGHVLMLHFLIQGQLIISRIKNSRIKIVSNQSPAEKGWTPFIKLVFKNIQNRLSTQCCQPLKYRHILIFAMPKLRTTTFYSTNVATTDNSPSLKKFTLLRIKHAHSIPHRKTSFWAILRKTQESIFLILDF